MKTASDTLIAFLASGKAMVMWDTFTFTLADGTVLAYSTRDPDAPALPTAPPDTFDHLLDTFTGDTPFIDHVGEQAANWLAANPDRENDFDLFTVQDGALENIGYAFPDGRFFTQWVPPGDEASIFMRANFSMESYGTAMSIGMQGDDFNRWAEVYAYVDNGNGGVGARVFLTAYFYSMTSNWNASMETSIIPSNDPFEVRFEITQNRRLMTVFLNDVSVMNGNLALGDSLGALDSSYIGPIAPGSLLRVNEIEGGLLGSLFALDTFEGTGSLSTHVGEIGAEWAVSDASPVPSTAGALLNGSGGVYLSNLYSSQRFLASGNVPTDDTPLYVEIDVGMNGDGYNGQWVGCGIASEDLSFMAGVELFVFAFTPTLALQYFDGGWTEEVVSPATDIVPYQTNTLRFELDDSRTLTRAYINGIEVASHTFNTPLPAMARPMLYFGSAGEARPVLRFEGGGIT